MNHNVNRFENPERLAELSPAKTLIKIGLEDGMTLCDIGAGSGIFSVAAAKITTAKVFATDINPEMLSVIAEKANAQGLKNIQTAHSSGISFDLPDACCDIALMVTVLHEIDEKVMFIAEMKRILRTDGTLAVIEFHKRKTPMGPPEAHRLGIDDVAALVQGCGLHEKRRFDLGDNFYCILFENRMK